MEGIKFTFWNLLFLVAAAQGIFLAIVLLTNKQGSKSRFFLSSLIILFSVTLVFYVLFWSGISSRYKLAFDLVLRSGLLFGPLAYLYMRSVKGYAFSPRDLKHFYIFPLATMLTFIPFANIDSYTKLVLPLIECILLVFYSTLIFRARNRRQLKSHRVERFLKEYSVLFIVFTLSFVSYYILFYTGVLRLEYDHAISLCMAAIIYFTGYRAYFLPELHNGNISTEKYERSGLTSSAEKYYADKIQYWMDKEKVYRNSDLRLRDLAEKLDISSHHVSQIINSFYRQSFPDFVNKFRVEAAKEMINSPDHRKDNLIDIAYSCGFNNKVSFNKAFHKIEGISPGDFRKLNQIKNPAPLDSKYHQAEA